MHDDGREEKDPSVGDEEDNLDRLTAFDPKDFEDLTENNEGKKDSMIQEIQENHSGHSMAVDEDKNKNKKEKENVEREIVLKLKDQKLCVGLNLQSAGDDVYNEGNQKYIYILIDRIHPHRQPMHDESFDNFFADITSIKYRQAFVMQRNNQGFASIRSVQQTFSTDWLDMYDLTLSAISSIYSSSQRTFICWMHNLVNEIKLDLSSRRTGHMSKCDSLYALMPHSSQIQSEQHSLKEAVTTSSETSDGRQIKASLLNIWQLKEQIEMLYMHSIYEKESLEAEKWYLEWRSDHPFFRCTILHVNAVRFGAEGIPPRHHIHLPLPALPLTGFLEFNSGFNVPAARAEVATEGPNLTANSAQEQWPNQSSETENSTTFSGRAGVEEFPSMTSVDEGNGYCLECGTTLSLRPSNDDQEATALERTVLKWNFDTNNSGSEEKIPRVHSHPVEESAESEANDRPTFPNQTAAFIHDWPPYLDHTSQQVAEVGSIFRDSLDNNSTNYTGIRDVANSMAPICDNVGVAAASTPGVGEKYLMTAAAQSVLFMGYQPRVVLLAIRRVLMNRVGTEMTGHLIMEAVFEIEEEEDNKCPSTPSSELDQGNIPGTDSLNISPTNDTAVGDEATIYGAIGGAAASTPGIGEMQKYLLTDAAQSVLDMGYEPNVVLLAIERVLMKREFEEMTGQKIMEAVFEIEEIMKMKSSSSWLDQVHGSTGPGQGDEETEGACGEELPVNLKEMRENRTSTEANLCIMCQFDTISAIFLPCGHKVCCTECAVTVRKCPVCCTLIRQYVTTYLYFGGNKPA